MDANQEYAKELTRFVVENAEELEEHFDKKHSELAALSIIRRTRRQLDELEAALVHKLRDEGWTWARIGDYFDISKQAAHKKFARQYDDELD